MPARLVEQSYGKSHVRLTKVTRHTDHHDLTELDLQILLSGDFTETYLHGDNRRVVATDTMKNTVYALAADHPLDDPESFALLLANHFVDRHDHVHSATVDAALVPWRRIRTADGGGHRHSFLGGGAERRTCQVCRRRDGVEFQAGIRELALLKTTDSAFRGFLRDEFTTLVDTDDRIFATLLNAHWTYAAQTHVDWNTAYRQVRDAMVSVFANHHSLSVQQTLFAMGQAALDVCPAMVSIRLEMPNQHRIPVNLQALGKPKRNSVFVTTSEPYGLIQATLHREDRHG